MTPINSAFIGKTQNFLHHGSPKPQYTLKEIIMIQKEYRQTLMKKSL